MRIHTSKKIVFLFAVSIVALILYVISKPYFSFIKEITGVSAWQILLLPGDFKQTQKKVNIVLLGKGGIQHDGPNLTDSISVLSYNLESKKITLISLPRDIWSPTLQDKINSAYAYGQARKKGGGITLAKSEIGAVVDLPIHYGVVVEFEKFKEIIDYVGGIEINVERSFTDEKFPIDGKENDECNGDTEYKCRYKTVTFNKGHQKMDGATALNFVRSRNAQGEEGTDFARNKRQQKVLEGLYIKLLSKIKEMRVDTLRDLYKLLDNTVERDIQNSEAAYLGRSILYGKSIEVVELSLPEELFIIPPRYQYKGKYVLIPKNEKKLHEYILCVLETGIETTCKTKL